MNFASQYRHNRGLETYVKVIDENCSLFFFEVQDKTKVGSCSCIKFKLFEMYSYIAVQGGKVNGSGDVFLLKWTVKADYNSQVKKATIFFTQELSLSMYNTEEYKLGQK